MCHIMTKGIGSRNRDIRDVGIKSTNSNLRFNKQCNTWESSLPHWLALALRSTLPLSSFHLDAVACSHEPHRATAREARLGRSLECMLPPPPLSKQHLCLDLTRDPD